MQRFRDALVTSRFTCNQITDLIEGLHELLFLILCSISMCTGCHSEMPNPNHPYSEIWTQPYQGMEESIMLIWWLLS